MKGKLINYQEASIYLQRALILPLLLNLNILLAQTNFNGTYTIGTASGTEDYATISAAIADLKSGTITGDVTYQIGAGTYNENMDLSSLNNGGFTITFSGVTKELVVIHPLDSIVADKSGISLENTNNVVLENFKLEMDDISATKVNYESNETKGINVSNSSNITIENIALSNSNFVVSEALTEFIASAVSLQVVENVTIRSSEFSGAGILIFIDDYQNVVIEDSDFHDGQFHIRGFQEADTHADGMTIKGNTFTGPFPTGRAASAIYLIGHTPNFLSSSFSSNVLIENNFIDGVDEGGTSYGIYISAIEEPIVKNNTVHNGYVGIFDKGCTLALIESNEIIGTSNIGLSAQNLGGCNYINNIVSSENTALTIAFSSNVRLVHNTFHASGNGTGIGLTGASGDSLVIVNNIFSVESTIQNEVLLDFIKPNEVTINNNLYSGNASLNTVKMVMWGGGQGPSADFETLSDWQAYELNMDQSSQSFEPVFAGDGDYHISDDANYRFGTFLNDITTDIDDDYRNPSTGIDVGADQHCVQPCLAPQVPTIASFFPDNGPVGTSVTIFGNNFSTSPSDNIVYFGAVQATVAAASLNELVVAVPAGASYQPITVQTNGLIGESLSPFEVTFESDGTIAETTLATSETFGTGMEATATVTGDLDGDGLADIVVANATGNSISILRNTSSGVGNISFDEKVDLVTAGRCIDVLLADLDGDGKLDITVGHSDNSNVSIFRNTSSGDLSFDARQDVGFGTDSYSIASGDLDGDGKVDLAITDKQSDKVLLLVNQSSIGSISFGLFNSFTTGDSPVSVAIVDVDQDQIKDVVVANQTDLTISVLLNDGAMNLTAKQDFVVGGEPTQVISGDLDGDNIEDLIVTAPHTIAHPTSKIRLFRNTSTPGSLNLVSSDLNVLAGWVHPNDINGDGKTDILYSELFTGLYMIKNLSSVGALSFDQEVNVLPEVSAFNVSANDLDNDGEPDIILSGLTQDLQDVVEVFRNLNSGTDFSSFSIPEQSTPATIDVVNHTVDVSLVDCSDITTLTASFEARGASVDVLGAMGTTPQTSGVTENDFTIPLTYVITSEDGATIQNWLVSVSGSSFSDEVVENVIACDNYLFDSNTLTTSGQYQGMFTNLHGCDSLVTLNLTINESDDEIENVVACDSYLFDGTTLTTTGQYQGMFTNLLGCDSLVTLNLTINESDDEIENVVACDSYLFDGSTLTTTGQYQAMFTNLHGCDSLVTLNLTINESDDEIENVVACDSYLFDGNTLTSSGQYQGMFTNLQGCDQCR